MLKCLGNFIGKGKERDVIISQIQNEYKLKKNITINAINEVRYLSFCNLAEILVDYEKSIEFFLKQNIKAKNLSDIQIEYFKIYQDPFIKITLKFLKTLSLNIIKPIMKKGNTTTSCIEYENCLSKVLLEITSLKSSNLKDYFLSFSFQTEEMMKLFQEKSKSIFNILLDSSLDKLQKWESKYIQKSIENGQDKFVICSNRQAERYISSIKQLLEKNFNTRLILIMSFCKLRTLNFNFDSFSKDLKIILKKNGRNLYNNSMTRRKINQNKAFLYFQQLEHQVEKQTEINKIDMIRDFLIDMEYLNESEKLTLKNMKLILEKLQTEGYYTGNMKVGNKEKYLELFENEIINIDFINI